nr:pilus assembly protein [Mesorhizobium sp. LNHC220B00]
MLLNRFWRSKSGNFALLMGLGLPAILSAVAFATDVSTMMRAKSNLQNALDAANLASSHLGDLDITRTDAFDRYFQANIAGHGELVNAKATLAVDRGVNFIKTKAVASADVGLNFAFLFGQSKHIVVDASAVESNNQLEVVLVLDNTGSMAGARIAALRTATKSLLDTLEATKSPTREVRASLVPFVTAVNVNGDEFDPSWVDMDGKSSTNGVNFPVVDGKRPNHMALFKQLKENGWTEPGWNGTGWKGCVEARPGAYNISDTPPDPAKPDSLFVPYFAPDDPEDAQMPSASYGNSAKYYNNSYLDDVSDKAKLAKQKGNLLRIDFSDLLGDVLAPGNSAKEKIAKYVAPARELITETGSAITVGPNRACPTPVVPLTGDFDKLRKAASQMTEWNGSGTNVSEGLSWGMRVLSPGAPYTDGAPWKTPGVSKIVLLLTDGENVVYGASEQPTKSDYTSYGYLAGGRFGSDNQTAAARNVDGWTKSVCTQLKDEGVQIYTMVLQSDTAANRTL